MDGEDAEKQVYIRMFLSRDGIGYYSGGAKSHCSSEWSPSLPPGAIAVLLRGISSEPNSGSYLDLVWTNCVT